MLYRIIEKDHFSKCIDLVRKLYWPEDIFRTDKYWDNLKTSASSADELNNKLTEHLFKPVKELDNYTVIDPSGNETLHLPFPLLERFYTFFGQRYWSKPIENINKERNEIIQLQAKKGIENHSKNVGNYFHFINVVAALARLIDYFKTDKHVNELLGSSISSLDLHYANCPNIRSFKLMIAGFYHDIGKTVINPRHAMEGATILQYHTTHSRAKLNSIAQAYETDHLFDRDDFVYVADLVYYHDQFGTISTGEDGYLPFVAIIDRLKRYSLHEGVDIEVRRNWTKKYLFDLWLLNIADIIVSLDSKFEDQTEFRKSDQGDKNHSALFWINDNDATDRINDFFHNEGHDSAQGLIHDLSIGFKLVDEHCRYSHTDNLADLSVLAHDFSRRHVTERLRRLVCSSLRRPASPLESDSESIKILKTDLKMLRGEEWNAIIVNAIQALSDFNSFCDRFSWIGKMDYALGFFEKIATHAISRVNDELKGGTATHWIRSQQNSDDEIDKDYLTKTNAQFFADNYALTVVQILNHLLFRDPAVNGLRNIEFSDAQKRLTHEKMDHIISQEGPFRASKGMQSILQTIYIY